MHPLTEEEVCNAMATKSGDMGAAEWADFFTLPPEAQASTANLYKNAIWTHGGPDAWAGALAILGMAATVFGEMSGIGTAFTVLKGLV